MMKRCRVIIYMFLAFFCWTIPAFAVCPSEIKPGQRLSEEEIRDCFNEITRIRADLNKLDASVKGIRILGVAQVRNRKLLSSTKDVTFNPDLGLLEFPNPDRLKFVPILSDISPEDRNPPYVSYTNIIARIIDHNKFTVIRSKMDATGNPVYADYFSAIVIGFSD